MSLCGPMHALRMQLCLYVCRHVGMYVCVSVQCIHECMHVCFMTILAIHSRRSDETVRQRTVHPPSYSEAKIMKLLTLYAYGCLRVNFKVLNPFFFFVSFLHPSRSYHAHGWNINACYAQPDTLIDCPRHLGAALRYIDDFYIMPVTNNINALYWFQAFSNYMNTFEIRPGPALLVFQDFFRSIISCLRGFQQQSRNHHHHLQFLTPAIWRRQVRMNGFHCLWFFVKSIAPFNACSIDSMTSFILSIHRGLGLSLFLYPLNLACSALCGIRSTVIRCTCPNHRSLRGTTLSSRFVGCPMLV